MKNMQFSLVSVYCNEVKEIFVGSAAMCQYKKTELKKEPQYRNVLLQVRRKDNLAFVKVLKRDSK